MKLDVKFLGEEIYSSRVVVGKMREETFDV